MLDYPQIAELVEGAAKSKLGRNNVVRVMTEPGIDSEGQDALRITIVIAEGAVDRITGDALVDNLVAINDQLRRTGDDRLPLITYATEEELQDSDDPEP